MNATPSVLQAPMTMEEVTVISAIPNALAATDQLQLIV